MGAFSVWHWLIVFLAFSAFNIPAWWVIKKAGKSRWHFLPAMTPLINLVWIYFFAFGRWPSENVGVAGRAVQNASREPDAIRFPTSHVVKPENNSFFAKHWRGELPLAISYWVNVFLLNIVSLSAIFGLGAISDKIQNAYYLLALMVFAYVSVLLIAVWQIVGAWRSATNHKIRYEKHFWASVVQLLMVVGTIQVAVAEYNGVKTIVAIAEMATGSDGLSKFEIKVDGKNLRIDGYISFPIIDEFDNFIKYNANIDTVILNSLGGRAGPSRHIQQSILAHKLKTHTETICLSGCTLAFLAGSQRTINVGAKLGFHQQSLEGLSESDIRELSREDVAFFDVRGVSKDFTQRAFNTPADDMWYPSFHELMKSGFITHVGLFDKTLLVEEYCQKVDCKTTSTAPAWLQKYAAQANMSIPIDIDWNTRLESATAGPGNNFTYSYSILSVPVEDFEVIGKLLEDRACKNDFLMSLFQNGIVVHWQYSNIRGAQDFEKIVKPSFCLERTSSN